MLTKSLWSIMEQVLGCASGSIGGRNTGELTHQGNYLFRDLEFSPDQRATGVHTAEKLQKVYWREASHSAGSQKNAGRQTLPHSCDPNISE